MKASFTLLAIVDLLILGLTAMVGLQVRGDELFAKHVLLGVLAAIFTCFLHIVAFMYFVVQEKIARQAVQFVGTDPSFHAAVIGFRGRMLRLAISGIGSIICVVALGAAVDIDLPSTPHLLAAFLSILLNAWICYRQLIVIAEYAVVRREFLGES